MHNQLQEITSKLNIWESRFADALDAAEVGIWEWDLEENKLYWDGRMFKIFKVDKSNFSGKYEDFSSRIHPDDLKSLESQIKDCIDLNIPFVYFFRVKDPTIPTGWKYVKGKGKVFRDASGKAVRMSGVNMVSDCPEDFFKPPAKQSPPK